MRPRYKILFPLIAASLAYAGGLIPFGMGCKSEAYLSNKNIISNHIFSEKLCYNIVTNQLTTIKKSTLIELIILAVLCAGASPSSGAAIIADHQAAANFSNIPSEYFSLARSTFNIYYINSGYDVIYGQRTHGTQVITGMSMLENENENYAPPSIYEVGPSNPFTHPLGYPGWELITRWYLDEHPETNLVVWSWCPSLSFCSA
jgi:hypothetical protein